MGISGKTTLELYIIAKNRAHKAFLDVKRQMNNVKKSAGGLNGAMKGVQNSISSVAPAAGKLMAALGPMGLAGVAVLATAAIVGMGAAAVKSFAAFEDAMANVRKTTGMTKEQIKDLGGAIDKMALAIPVAHDELAKIAAIAGQLGIQGKSNILGFTEDIAKMSTAFDMSAESAATAMAKMANIYGIPIEQVSSLGSAINVLGNTTAAQESQIMDFSMSLGAAGKQLGFGATESVAMGASLIAMGMDASAAGTRLNSAFTQMAKNTDKVSKFLGKTEVEFRAAFGEDPMGMIIQIVGKLGEIEDPLERNAAAAEMFGLIGAKAINTMSGDLDGLQTNLANSAKGFEENTSLTEEFAAKTDTLKAKFALVGNATESLKINIGEALSPLAGALANTALTAIKGLGIAFDMLQKVAGPALSSIFNNATLLKAFFEGFLGPIVNALRPLFEMIKSGVERFNKLSGSTKLLADVMTILTAGAKWLGNAIGTLVANALTPFVAKIKEAIEMLAAFYDKLGPIKGLIGGVKEKFGGALEGISKWAESIKKAEPVTEELGSSISELIEEAIKVEPALEEGIIKPIKEAAEAQKEFEVTIGDTTITFKDMAAEVVKNVDAYKDLEGNAKALLDLDWSVFTELEAELPNIDAGIQNMSDAFGGLKVTLEENAENLEIVKKSVMEIGTIAAPFLEKGFTKGVESINNFAGSLSAAGTAINSFGDLTEVNVEGCINFSTSVYSMVSALGVLETQMHDMKPAFADMEAGIRSTLEAFIFPGGDSTDIEARITDPIKIYRGILDKYELAGNWAKDAMKEEFGQNWAQQMSRIPGFNIEEYALEVLGVPGGDISIFKKASDDYNRAMTDIRGSARAPGFAYSGREFKIRSIGEDIDAFASDVVHSSRAIEIAVNKQVSSLTYWSEQLTKITDALKPYLSFMQTLNEITVLSTLSSDDINAGFNAISDTLTNLSTVIKDVDFAPIMDALFGEYKGEGIFAGGAATDFIMLMQTYSPKLNELVTFTDNLSGAITNLTSAFDALVDIEDSVLMDTDVLGSLLSNVETIVNNLAEQLSSKGGNFGAIIADSFTELLKAGDPLIVWFRKNSVQVTEFNSALGSLMLTIKHISDAMKSLQEIAAATVPEVGELAAGFDKAAKFTTTFNEALIKHLDTHKTLADISLFSGIDKFAKDWKTATKEMEDSFETFGIASSNILTLISNVMSLSEAFAKLAETTIISTRDMDKALKNVDVFIGHFVEALRLNLDDLVESLITLDVEWDKHAEEMQNIMPTYKTATSNISTLIGSLTSLSSALKSLAETGTITSTTFDKGFGALIESVSNFAVSLSRNIEPLIGSLSSLKKVWTENQAVLVPLMIGFNNVTKSFRSIAINATNMAIAFKELKKNSYGLEGGFKALIKFIKDVVAQTKEFYTPEAARQIARYIIDVGFVVAAFKNLSSALGKATSNIETKIRTSVNNVSRTIQSLKTLIPNMFAYGSALMFSFIAGINAWKGVLIATMASIANIIKSYLGVESPTELGALKDVEKWPRNLVKSFSDGINAEMGTLNNSFGAMNLSAVTGSGGGRNRTSVVFNVTQNISDKATADYSTRELERMINRHQVL